jgi:hypothetical protein
MASYHTDKLKSRQKRNFFWQKEPRKRSFSWQREPNDQRNFSWQSEKGSFFDWGLSGNNSF